MEYGGYTEDDLIANRSALLLYGGTEAERRAWAHEASGHFASEGPLLEIHNADELQRGLAQGRGVAFIPDALALGLDAQGQVLRCIQEREERPKIVVGLSRLPDEAIQQGVLREDLSYRLRLARVNLDANGLRESIEARRAKLEEKLAAAKELVQPRKKRKRSKGRRVEKSKAARARPRTPAKRPSGRSRKKKSAAKRKR